MERMELSTAQRNAILRLVRAGDFDLAHFQWHTAPSAHLSGIISVLRYGGTHHFFHFDLWEPGVHWARFSPGESAPVQEEDTRTWAEQVAYVRKWLRLLDRKAGRNVQRVAAEGRSLLKARWGAATANDPLAGDDVHMIRLSLLDLGDFIAGTAGLDEGRVRLLDARLRYLEERAEQLGRGDLINLLPAFLEDVLIELSLTPDEVREVFWWAPRSFYWLANDSRELP